MSDGLVWSSAPIGSSNYFQLSFLFFCFLYLAATACRRACLRTAFPCAKTLHVSPEAPHTATFPSRQATRKKQNAACAWKKRGEEAKTHETLSIMHATYSTSGQGRLRSLRAALRRENVASAPMHFACLAEAHCMRCQAKQADRSCLFLLFEKIVRVEPHQLRKFPIEGEHRRV